MGIYDDILDSVRLPRMYRVSQEFARDRVTDIAGTIRREISQIPDIGRVIRLLLFRSLLPYHSTNSK